LLQSTGEQWGSARYRRRGGGRPERPRAALQSTGRPASVDGPGGRSDRGRRLLGARADRPDRPVPALRAGRVAGGRRVDHHPPRAGARAVRLRGTVGRSGRWPSGRRPPLAGGLGRPPAAPGDPAGAVRAAGRELGRRRTAPVHGSPRAHRGSPDPRDWRTVMAASGPSTSAASTSGASTSGASAAGADRGRGRGPSRRHDPNYKWVALSNTTLGLLMAAIDGSIVIISLPAIFNGIHLDPLEPGSTSYLLWIFMGYLLVTAVLVVAFGWLGDRYGRVRMYNAGFAIFTVGSLLLAGTPFMGTAGALWIIGMRIVQGIGGAFLFANSAAILTDAFPVTQRGLALGINGVAAIAGQFIGLLLGGFLATIDWRLVFFVSVPIGIIGTIWAYLRLEELSTTSQRQMDWWGNITFGVGLAAILIGITYGIQPYGTQPTGWTSPLVISLVGGGILLLALFLWIERRVKEPFFDLSLFRIRAFAAGNLAGLLASTGRGGLSFMLVICLQGIWLPLHGYRYADTPLWAGIYMLPLTAGFL